MDDLSKELTVEMLPDNQWKQVAEEIGIENFCKMLKIVGGATLYIPQLDNILRPVRDARIKAEFDKRKLVDPYFKGVYIQCGSKAMTNHWGLIQEACHT